jgi:GNAT superfamily N-acetyltransferase
MTLNLMTLEPATPEDAAEIARLRTAVAVDLTRRHGPGHWSAQVSEAGVLRSIHSSRIYVARQHSAIVGTLRLAEKKPWAIDPAYFSAAAQPIYLTDMAVAPAEQGKGIGRRCLEDAGELARHWPADVIRLDAYDAPAGAGGFYDKCGFRNVGRAMYRGVPLLYFERLIQHVRGAGAP